VIGKPIKRIEAKEKVNGRRANPASDFVREAVERPCSHAGSTGVVNCPDYLTALIAPVFSRSRRLRSAIS